MTGWGYVMQTKQEQARSQIQRPCAWCRLASLVLRVKAEFVEVVDQIKYLMGVFPVEALAAVLCRDGACSTRHSGALACRWLRVQGTLLMSVGALTF